MELNRRLFQCILTGNYSLSPYLYLSVFFDILFPTVSPFDIMIGQVRFDKTELRLTPQPTVTLVVPTAAAPVVYSSVSALSQTV